MSWDWDPFKVTTIQNMYNGTYRWYCDNCGSGWKDNQIYSTIDELWSGWLDHVRYSHGLFLEDTRSWTAPHTTPSPTVRKVYTNAIPNIDFSKEFWRLLV